MASLGLGEVVDYEVRGCEGSGGNSLLMRPLAVDDARVVLASLVVHRVPHLRIANIGSITD